ncbi:hypothetical protein [Streptomyces sp. TS71-3]|uniref:hypothetical protein n=1 Tax=Streptomyces sp. TS71-3 TaxID=2733862 RepID=UPI001BB3A706
MEPLDSPDSPDPGRIVGPGCRDTVIDGLDRYHLLHATRADLLRRLGRTAEAASAYRRAHELAANPADRRFLAGRLHDLDVTEPR